MDKEQFKRKVMDSDEFAIGCLVALFRMQESDERSGGYTAHRNDAGFNSFDAPVLTNITQYYIDKGFLSIGQLKLIKSKIPKYHAQLSWKEIIEFPNNAPSAPSKTKEGLRGPFIIPCEGKDKGLFMKASIGDMFKIDYSKAKDLVGEIKLKMTNRRFVADDYFKYWKVAQTVFNYDTLVEMEFKPSDELKEWRKTQVSIEEADDDIFIPGIKAELYPFQKKGVSFVEARNGRALIADDMGCIDGEAVLTINRNKASKKIKLKDLYERFSHWNGETKTRSLKEDFIGLNNIQNVLYKGKRKTLFIETKKGRKLKLTPDHEILTPNGDIEAGNLKIGDIIFGNGKEICSECGGAENIITYKYAKFRGYCKSCMYSIKRKNGKEYEGIHRYLDKNDGYVYLRGSDVKNHPRYTSSGLLEHIYIAELEILGRPLKEDELVHHKDEDRQNNDPENLEVTNTSRHHITHNRHRNFGEFTHKTGSKIFTIPEHDKITKISNGGVIDVYDIVMDDPYRNFVINGFIVHNCGKTLESLAWTEYRGNSAYPLLVICPANLKRNWYREIHKFVDKPTVEIVGGRTPYKKLSEFSKDIFTMIINYDVINNWEDFIINEFRPNTIIIDEGHFIKNERTKRYKSVKKITDGVDHLMILTGTPIESKLEDSYPMIHLISPSMFPNKKALTYKYVDKKLNEKGRFVTVGLKNAEELHRILTTEIMIRRLKEDVLSELPPKQTSIIPCELSNKREYAIAEEDFINWLREIDEGKAARAENAEAITRINYLKQLAAKGKLEDVYQFIDSFLAQDEEEKLIIFCMHHSIMNAIYDRYSKMSMTFHGKMSSKQKESAEQNFKDDPKQRLFIMQIESGGVGLNLVESSNVLHVEFPWNPSKMDQATDRVHRIGQMKPVSMYIFATEGTIEDKLISILDLKRGMSDAVIDGKKEEEIELLSELIKMYKKEDRHAKTSTKRKRRNAPHRRPNRVS